jgi:hypothetical protein
MAAVKSKYAARITAPNFCKNLKKGPWKKSSNGPRSSSSLAGALGLLPELPELPSAVFAVARSALKEEFVSQK